MLEFFLELCLERTGGVGLCAVGVELDPCLRLLERGLQSRCSQGTRGQIPCHTLRAESGTVTELIKYKKIKLKKVMWGDSAYPFCDVNRGRLCLDRTSNTRTCKYMQVLVVSLYVSKKVFFLHFSGNVDQVYCCWMQQNN